MQRPHRPLCRSSRRQQVRWRRSTAWRASFSRNRSRRLAALITAALPVINPLIDKVLAIPGVSDIAKPAIDSLRAQLDALAKA